MLWHILRGHRSAWFPLWSASRFVEFDTSIICHVSVLFWLISIARYVFKSPNICFWGTEYDTLNVLLTCILNRDAAVDYMHCICEGAVDQHLNAWFEDKSSNQYLGTSLKELDITLLSIKPISEITRRPRSLSDWKQWKGMDCLLVWLLVSMHFP